MKDKSKLKHISIQSKVSPEAAACLDDIVKKYKFKSRYEVMQYLLTAFCHTSILITVCRKI